MALSIGRNRQLFLDDGCIEEIRSIERRFEPARKSPHNPVLIGGRPWDIRPILYGSVFREAPSRYRMWYRTGPADSHENYTCYGESEDGVHWDLPAQDILRGTNVVFGTPAVPHMAESYTVLHDTTEVNPERRYKVVYKTKEWGKASPFRDMIFRNYRNLFEDLASRGRESMVKMYRDMISDALFLESQKRTIGTAVSPDGVRWKVLDTEAVRFIGDISHLTWDPYRKRYLLYARDFFIPEEAYDRDRGEEWFRKTFWGRAVRLVESEDFESWTPGDIVFYADGDDRPGDEIYSLAVFPYEGIFIGLVQVYHAHPDTNKLEVQLAVSRDGERWVRVGSREPFIASGEIGDWDRWNIAVASAPVRVGDELRFYYSGHNNRHRLAGKPFEGKDTDRENAPSAIGFASTPVDRFVSLASGFEGGVLLTRSMVSPGGELHVNAKADHGIIKVAVLDDEGHPVEGLEDGRVTVDDTDIKVEWSNGRPDGLTGGKPFRLRFELRNARLYSFRLT